MLDEAGTVLAKDRAQEGADGLGGFPAMEAARATEEAADLGNWVSSGPTPAGAR